MLLLGELEVRGVLLMFPRNDRRYRQFLGIVEGIPRFRNEVFGVGIKETRPEEERFSPFRIGFHQGIRPFCNPRIVVVFLWDQPFAPLVWVIPRRVTEVVSPIRASLLLHPDRIMLPDMGFIRMIPSEFHMFKTVERTVEFPPEVEILQDRIGFEGGELFGPS